MKLVFVSNILNHHQIALCREFQKRVEEFSFIATSETEAIGYQMSQESDFVLHYCNTKERNKCLEYILDADVVIFGSCPNELIQMRMEVNKLSFLYTERFLKKGVYRRFIPRTRKKMMERIGCYKEKNMYVLCASAYASYDLSLIGYPIEKCYKWGYFPETKKYEDINRILELKIPSSILWVGRFIEWKHPEIPILIAKKLRDKGYLFNLTLIGSGELMPKLQKKIEKYQLQEYVSLKGSMKPEKVRAYMEKSNIFLFTSDRYEGWGAVLNEAMNSACGVVANYVIGAAPFLIEDGENGFIYTNSNDLLEKVEWLLKNSEMCHVYGKRAYGTIEGKWNAEVAANRFLTLCSGLEQSEEEKKEKFSHGPCSLAEQQIDKR